MTMSEIVRPPSLRGHYIQIQIQIQSKYSQSRFCDLCIEITKKKYWVCFKKKKKIDNLAHRAMTSSEFIN